LLGWDAATTAHEIAVYQQAADAIAAAAALTRDDESASDVREAAPEIVPLMNLHGSGLN
jgi:glycerol-3-phosphate dehydrogenase